jgi:hypothetical protein
MLVANVTYISSIFVLYPPDFMHPGITALFAEQSHTGLGDFKCSPNKHDPTPEGQCALRPSKAAMHRLQAYEGTRLGPPGLYSGGAHRPRNEITCGAPRQQQSTTKCGNMVETARTLPTLAAAPFHTIAMDAQLKADFPTHARRQPEGTIATRISSQ